MWILPKNLSLPRTSQMDGKSLVLSGSTATVEMLSDLNEQSQACAASLSVRGTPSSLRTWSAKWKRDSWTQYLSGRMLRTSPQNHSVVARLICSSHPTLAKVSPMQASASGLMTTATSGPTAESLSELFAPDMSGLKTSKDTFRLDSPQSLPTWKKMVIQRRGEYSARLKSARLTKENGCLSWPSASTRDFKGDRRALKDGQNISDTTGTSFGLDLNQAVKMWPTTTTRDYKGCGNAVDRQDGKSRMDTLEAIVKYGLPSPVPASTDGSRRESYATDDNGWTTPCAGDLNAKGRWNQGGRPLTWQAKESWRTSSSSECNGGQASPEEMTEAGRTVKLRYQVEGAKIGAQTSAKLNPRWVETLMGLPLGWTSPDAPASLILNWKKFTDGWLRVQTERTSCECAEMELCPKPPSAPSELSLPKSKDMPGQTFLL